MNVELTTNSSIGDRTAQGATWSAVAFGTNKVVLFIASAVLAHLLTPAEFGLVAIAMVVIGYVERLSEGGLESAIITFPGDDKSCFEHGLAISLALGAMFTVAGVATAPLIAVVFDEPDVAPVVAVLSILYLTTSVRQMLSGGLARRMQFAKRLVPELTRAGVKALVMVGLALQGFGVWALTLGHLAGAVVGVVAYWIALGERIRPRVSRSVTKSLVRLGGSFSLVALIGTIIQNSDYVMIGLRADSSAVGIYSIGFRIPEITVLAIPVVASQALVSAFVRVAKSSAELREAYVSSLGLLALLLTPLGLGLSLVADDLVPLIFGSQWDESVPVVQRVGLFGLFSGLAFPFGDVLKATDRTNILIRLGLLRLAVTLPLLWVAAGQGLTQVANVHLGLAICLLIVSMVLASKFVGASFGAQLVALRTPAVAGLALVAVVMAIAELFENGLIQLMLSVVIGATIYLLVVTLLDRATLTKAWAFLPISRVGR